MTDTTSKTAQAVIAQHTTTERVGQVEVSTTETIYASQPQPATNPFPEAVTSSKREAWECKIGILEGVDIPRAADGPMRKAVAAAFEQVTGREAEYIFSGWGAKASEAERAVVLNKDDAALSAVETEERTFDYMTEAALTKSPQFNGQLVSLWHLRDVMTRAIAVLNELDAIKKALFYGKKLPASEQPSHAQPSVSAAEWQNVSTSPAVAFDLAHCIIGKATESGEGLEALFAAIFGGELFDVINFIEETGDGFWYDAIGLAAIGSNFGEAQAVNISKLRKRYPDKFTAFDAINRNTAAERITMEETDTAHEARATEPGFGKHD